MLRVVFVIFIALCYQSVALAQTATRHPEFVCPPELRPRVDFWIGVFAIYGKHQVVMHHRRFPQAVYSVLDMAVEGQSMSEAQFERYKKQKIISETAAITRAIKHIANGGSPRNNLEKNVKNALKKVPGGSSKYRVALEKDMIRSQTGIKEKFAESIKRSGRYMHVLEQVFVVENDLPIELTRLPFIESSFDYTAYSSVGAAGIWQFMPATARQFGMHVSRAVDERRDVLKATKAAARYLTQAYNSLGSWPLAVTSYNHGVAGVRKKVTAAGSNNIVKLIEYGGEPYFGFASGNFWPELLAAIEVSDKCKTYFPKLVKDSARHYVTHTLTSQMSPAYASRKLGVPIETLKEYNYALLPAVWRGQYHIPRGYNLKVPKLVAGRTLALNAPEQQIESSNVYGGATYTVRSGDTLSSIARKYGVTVAQIRDLNQLNNNIIRVGQRLLIKESEARAPSVTDRSPEQTRTVSVSSFGSSTYVVKAGDSISGIAARHGLSVRELMQLNNLRSTVIRVGQSLKVSAPRENKAPTVSAPAATQKVKTSTLQGYTVRRGDTLWSISKKLGVSVDRIKKANGLRNNNIKAGQRLKIPQ